MLTKGDKMTNNTNSVNPEFIEQLNRGIFFLYTPEKMSITLPVEHIRKHLSEKQITVLSDKIISNIKQTLKEYKL